MTKYVFLRTNYITVHLLSSNTDSLQQNDRAGQSVHSGWYSHNITGSVRISLAFHEASLGWGQMETDNSVIL